MNLSLRKRETLGRNQNREAEAVVPWTEVGHPSRSSTSVLLQERQEWEGGAVLEGDPALHMPRLS